MGDIIEYLRQFIAFALRPTIDLAQTIIFVALLSSAFVAFKVKADFTAYVTSGQFALVVVGIVLLTRFLWAPYQIWLHQREKILTLEKQITSISLQRLFTYDHTNFEINQRGKECDVVAQAFFLNKGAYALSWRMLDASLEISGIKMPKLNSTKSYYANPGNQAWFYYLPVEKIPCDKWPLVADLMFEVEYDNVPPVAPRITMRKTRFVIPSLNSKNIPSIDLGGDER